MDTWGYIERVRTKHGGCSDYRIAQLLDISKQAVAWYRQGRSADDETAAKIATLLGKPALEVIADIRASRAEAEGNITMATIWREAMTMAMSLVASPAVVKMPARAQAQTGGAMPAMALADSGMVRPARGKVAVRGRAVLKIGTGSAVEAGVGIEPAYADLQSAA